MDAIGLIAKNIADDETQKAQEETVNQVKKENKELISGEILPAAESMEEMGEKENG